MLQSHMPNVWKRDAWSLEQNMLTAEAIAHHRVVQIRPDFIKSCVMQLLDHPEWVNTGSFATLLQHTWSQTLPRLTTWNLIGFLIKEKGVVESGRLEHAINVPEGYCWGHDRMLAHILPLTHLLAEWAYLAQRLDTLTLDEQRQMTVWRDKIFDALTILPGIPGPGNAEADPRHWTFPPVVLDLCQPFLLDADLFPFE